MSKIMRRFFVKLLRVFICKQMETKSKLDAMISISESGTFRYSKLVSCIYFVNLFVVYLLVRYLRTYVIG